MSSIRGTLRAGMILGTLAAFTAAGFATDRGVRSVLLDDLDRSLRERGRWVASTVELAEEGLELGFVELEMGDFGPAGGTSFLEVWRVEAGTLYRSPSLAAVKLARPRTAVGEEVMGFERMEDGRRLRTYHARFVARVDPDLGPIPRGPVVELSLGRDLSGVERLMSRLHVLFVVIGLAAALLTLLILNGIVGHSLRPLDRLAGEIDALRADDLTRPLGSPGAPDELRPVVRRLNQLLERLHAAFERERTFSADIAHELRTPLAGLRSSLEVELSRPRAAERYEETLREALAMTLRMQHLVHTLLQLARLDAGLVTAEAAPTDVAALTRDSLAPLLARAVARRLDVRQSFAATAPVLTDAALLGTAIRNLLDNAISHADPGGRVSVDVLAAQDGVILRVANTGATVSQAEIPQLFARFVRGDRARGADGGHHGLGLSLVQRIAGALGLGVELRSEPGGEFICTLEVPRAGVPRKLEPIS